MDRRAVWFCVLGVGLGLLTGASGGWASGFAIVEQSGKGLGEAYAGGSTDTKDASSMFYNPAAIAWMGKSSLVFAENLILPSAEFTNDGSTSMLGTSLIGGNNGDSGVAAYVPNLYYAQGIGEGMTAGLAVNAPYGLTTDWSSDWVGRYFAIKSKLISVDVSPTFAMKVTDFLSLGASLNIQYVDAELSQAIDLGAIDAAFFSGAFGLTPQQDDGYVKVAGDDTGVGYSLGLLLMATDQTRIGLSYRSKVDHTIEGKADFDVPADAVGMRTYTGLFVDTDAKADLTTPESVSLGLTQELSDELAVKADVTWTRWSRFKELTYDFENPLQEDSTLTQNWKDTLRYALALNYLLSETVTLRTGVAYDESPVKTKYRSPRIPCNDRLWLALGGGFQLTESLIFDAGYAHLFIRDSGSNLSGDGYLNLKGEYQSSVDIVSAQLGFSF